MKTIKAILGITAIAAAVNMTFAADYPSQPRVADAKARVVSTGIKDADFVHKETTLGNAAKSKAAGPKVIAKTGSKDPNLLSCTPVGKATCSKNPCDGSMNMACCK